MIVDENVDDSDRDVVRAFVDFLWSEQAQEALVRSNFRVLDDRMMEEHADTFTPVASPFTVDDLGGWEDATSRIIEQGWRQIQRGIE